MTVKQFWQRFAPHALFGAFQFIIMLSIAQPIDAHEWQLSMAIFLTAAVGAICALAPPREPVRRFWSSAVALIAVVECWFLFSVERGIGRDDHVVAAVQMIIFCVWALWMVGHGMLAIRLGVIAPAQGVAQMAVSFASAATVIVYAGLVTDRLIPTAGLWGALFPIGELALLLIVPALAIIFSEVLERSAA